MSGNNGRQNWTRSMTIAVAIAAAAAIIGLLTGGKNTTTDRHYFQNSAGSVLFDHGKHNESAESCAVCHHDLYGSAQAVSCEECHDGEGMDPADFEHAELKELHERDCSRCHEQVKEDDQAVSCRTCHPGTQENENRFVGCMECHDDSDYTPDMMSHEELVEVEDHSCLGCHAPSSVSEAYHSNCTSCHLAAAPEKFSNEDGVRCSVCHLP